ncbi:MAG TPA: ester cyclase [Gaiellaceae bacterium]|jgi:predicted ester cyclase
MARAVDATELNREVIRRHYEKFAAGDWRAAGGDFAEEASNFGRPVGREGILRVLGDIYTTFPDWSMEIEDIAAEGDSVIVRCCVSGTHLGVGRLHVNGGKLVGIEPTGKRFEVQHIHWYKLRDGRIVEHYAVRDDLGMMSRLGF